MGYHLHYEKGEIAAIVKKEDMAHTEKKLEDIFFSVTEGDADTESDAVIEGNTEKEEV